MLLNVFRLCVFFQGTRLQIRCSNGLAGYQIHDDEETAKDGKIAKSIYQDYVHLGSGQCLTPCKILDLDTNGRSSANQGMERKVMLSIDFQKWVKKNQEKRLYTSLSLLAEVGGYVGIFLGYSFLNFTESLYNFLSLRIRS